MKTLLKSFACCWIFSAFLSLSACNPFGGGVGGKSGGMRIDASAAGITPTTFSSPKAILAGAQMSAGTDANNDGLIAFAELSPSADVPIEILLNSFAVDGDIITINGLAYTLTATDISNGKVVKNQVVIQGDNHFSVNDASFNSPYTIDFSADIEAPAAPQLLSLHDAVGSVLGEILTGGSTDDAQPKLQGNAEPNSTVHLEDVSAASIADIAVDSTGAWTYTPNAALALGVYSWQATASDAAGNISPSSSVFTFTLLAPVVPPVGAAIAGLELFDDANGDGIINLAETHSGATGVKVLLSSEAAAGDKITINGTLHTLSSADIGNGFLAADVMVTANNGSNTITAEDENSHSASLSYQADLIAPSAPVILGADDKTAPVLGNLYSHSETDETQPTFRGTAEAGSTIELTQDSTDTHAGIATNAQGQWSAKSNTAIADLGAHTWTAIAIDAAGNKSPASSPFELSLIAALAQVQPEVNLDNSALLGIIGADVAGLIDVSQQPVLAVDANNDIVHVRLSYNSGTIGLNLIGLVLNLLGGGEVNFAYSADMADEFGFTITRDSLKGLSLGGSDQMTLDINKAGGGSLDNLLLSEFLATVHADKDLVQLNLADNLSIEAWDSHGHYSSANLSQVLDAGVLSRLLGSGALPDYVQLGDSSDNTINRSVQTVKQRLYGFAGSDLLTGGNDNDILRGGAGDDSLQGGTGDDLVEGGAGNDTLSIGQGNDVVIYRLLDADDATGGNGTDTLIGFTLDAYPASPDASRIDVQALLDTSANINNLGDYLQLSYDAVNQRVTVKLDRDGTAGQFTSTDFLYIENQAAAISLNDLLAAQLLIF